MSKKSSTEQLAENIEMLTGSSWTQEQRIEVAELIRKYRFQQVGAALEKFAKLARESGNTELSEKLALGEP